MEACVMAQQLRALTALAEDKSLIPRIHSFGSQPLVTTAPGNSIPWSL